MSDFRISRRNALKAAAAAAPALWLAGHATPALAVTSADYANLRTAWRNLLIGSYSPTDSVLSGYLSAARAAAQDLWDSLNTSPSRTNLWSDLASTTDPADIRQSMDRLRTMALANQSPGSPLYGNTGLRADLISAFDWLLAHRYGTVTRYGNWWEWEIGTPLKLNDFCIVMWSSLTATQITTATNAIAYYAPDPSKVYGTTATGANLVWACTVGAVRGALSDNVTPLNTVKSAIGAVFPYVTTGDGFYVDGSFIQHVDVAYTGGYGTQLVSNLAPLLSALDGSPWESTSGSIGNVFDWVSESFVPYLYYGAMMDMVRGREISRYTSNDHQSGHTTIAAILQLAAFAPSADATLFRQLAKHWIGSDTFRDFFAYDLLLSWQPRFASIVQGRTLMQNAAITPASEPTGHTISSGMARAVHRRPSFAFGISMYSARTRAYESINAENLHGWYTGEGMTYVYLPTKLTQFANGFWPTVNPYRLAGTTVDVLALANGVSRPTTVKWAGGATVNGHGAVTMSLAAAGTTLTARKSWFCIGDRIVCLGVGINSTDGRIIETIIENRNIGPSGLSKITVDGTVVQATPNGTPSTLTNPGWAQIEGVGGYVFPAGGTVKALREDRSGQWSDINTTSDGIVYTRRYATLWFDHGTSPTNKTYAYIILPNATTTSTASFAASPDVTVVANTAVIQGVKTTSGDVAMVHAFQYGAPKTAGITVDKTASVVAHRSGGYLDLAIADPSQAFLGSVVVTVDGAATSTVSADPGVTVVALGPNVKVSVDVTGAKGRTFQARFQL